MGKRNILTYYSFYFFIPLGLAANIKNVLVKRRELSPR